MKNNGSKIKLFFTQKTIISLVILIFHINFRIILLGELDMQKFIIMNSIDKEVVPILDSNKKVCSRSTSWFPRNNAT